MVEDCRRSYSFHQRDASVCDEDKEERPRCEEWRQKSEELCRRSEEVMRCHSCHVTESNKTTWTWR